MGLEQALTQGLLGMVGGGAKVVQEQEKADRENAAKSAEDAARSERDMAIEERKLRLAGQIRREQLPDRLKEIEAEAKAKERGQAASPDNELRAAQAEEKRFELQQAKRKDAALQEWTTLAEQYDSATDEADKKYLFPLLQKSEARLSALGVNPRGTTSVVSGVNPMSGEEETKATVKTGVRTSPPESQQDKFIIGKQYKDASGNVATYRGNGQWE
jgi:colicin import membrane protein